MGDVLWYMARLAEELDTDLGLVAQHNIDKLADRKLRSSLNGSGDHR